MAARESDKPIVAGKPGNAGGVKGLTVIRRGLRERTAGHGTGVQFSTKLKPLTLRAGRSPKYQFISLMHWFTEDFLLACFGELNRNKAPGIDDVTVTEYGANLKANIRDLLVRLKTRNYRPQPVKRVYIPKPNGKQRPLGIPAVEDKLVQMACKKILEAVPRCFVWVESMAPVPYPDGPGPGTQVLAEPYPRAKIPNPGRRQVVLTL